MKIKLIALVIAAAMLAGCAKVVVVHVPNTEENMAGAKSVGDNANNSAPTKMEGIFYALPKTIIWVGIKVNHSVATPAPYMKFAAIFAPEGQPVCE